MTLAAQLGAVGRFDVRNGEANRLVEACDRPLKDADLGWLCIGDADPRR